MRAVLLFLIASVAGSALADAHEDALRATIGRLPPLEQQSLAKSAYAGHYTLSQLVTFSNDDGRLIATFHLPSELTKQFRDPAPLLVSLEGSPHAWAVHRRKAGTLDPGLSLVTLTCYAPDELWPFNRYAVSSDGVSVMVAAAQMFGPPRWQPYVAVSQGERAVAVKFRLEADKFLDRRVEVADLSQLNTRVPNLLDKYLIPVFRRIGAGLPASDVYRVFDQIPADPDATRRAWPLVAQLDAGNPTARDAALRALRAMGRPAVLATLRIPPDALSPEQRNRLAGFYAAQGWLHAEDIEAARRDEVFLSACLEDEDPAVRAAAGHLLAGVRAVRGLRR